MTKCHHCQTELDAKWLFCALCGKAVDRPALMQLSSEMISEVFAKMLKTDSESGSHARGVRSQVFEVIVRQALIGAPWRELCAGPMKVNGITKEEIEEELHRRGGGDNQSAPVPRAPKPSNPGRSIDLTQPSASEQLSACNDAIHSLSQKSDLNLVEMQQKLSQVYDQFETLIMEIRRMEQGQQSINSDLQLQVDLEREKWKNSNLHTPANEPDPHHIE